MIINGITLPNPEWGDSHNQVAPSVQPMYARDGITSYSYIKRNNEKLLTFKLKYVKHSDAMLVFDSFKANIGTLLSITDWDAVAWSGYITNMPFDITHIGRACADSNTDLDTEHYEFTIDFEGVQS